MATTSKELIEILEKYTDPDEIIIWQYYTRQHFDYDENQPALTNKQFGTIADKVGRWELWTDSHELISQAIFDYQNK